MSDHTEISPGMEDSNRRGFLAKASGVVSAAALSIIGCRPESSTSAGPSAALMQRIDGPFEFDTIPTSMPFGTPNLGYIPPEFRFFAAYTDRNDGLGGGRRELALWYRKPIRQWGHIFPLCAFFTDTPTKPLFGTAEAPSTAITIENQHMGIVPAIYHDGNWKLGPKAPGRMTMESRLEWKSGDAISFVFQLGAVSVALRGSPRLGVDRAELERVAYNIGIS